MSKRLKRNLVTLEFDGLTGDRQYQLVTYGAHVLKTEPVAPPRSWTDCLIERMIIIGLVDGDSRLPTPITALLGLLLGVLFVEASLALVFAEVSIAALLGWVVLLFAYGYLWLCVGATAVMRIRLRREGQLA